MDQLVFIFEFLSPDKYKLVAKENIGDQLIQEISVWSLVQIWGSRSGREIFSKKRILNASKDNKYTQSKTYNVLLV